MYTKQYFAEGTTPFFIDRTETDLCYLNAYCMNNYPPNRHFNAYAQLHADLSDLFDVLKTSDMDCKNGVFDIKCGGIEIKVESFVLCIPQGCPFIGVNLLIRSSHFSVQIDRFTAISDDYLDMFNNPEPYCQYFAKKFIREKAGLILA